MKKLGIFYTIIFTIILITFSFNANAHNLSIKQEVHTDAPMDTDPNNVSINMDLYMTEFDKQMEDVRAFFKEVTGKDVKTQVSNIENFPDTSGVVAYCMPTTRDTPAFLAFNHKLLSTMQDDIFQVILHEYVHCEYKIGHIQIGGSFMNDGGNPGLTKEQVKKQFVLFHKWYMDNYEAMR